MESDCYKVSLSIQSVFPTGFRSETGIDRRGNMKILLVMPEAGIHRLEMGRIKISFREAPLTLAMLAALVPPEMNAHITLIDENVQPIPFDQMTAWLAEHRDHDFFTATDVPRLAIIR